MNTPDKDRVNPGPLAGRRSDTSAVGLVPSRLHELAVEYEITRELGRGGTAVVYHARERELGREVAIKVVHQTHVDDAEAVARLAREARLVAQLRHPNIVTLFGTRQLADGSLALIMQYVPGRTLKAAVREDGPLPIVAVETVLREMALALQHAHQRQGLVHRDVKPENIYLDTEGGRTLLSDFGIARTTEVESSLTLVGTALGTPAYMSPEQIDGLPLDGRSDLYSLGLVAYEMITGQQPWAGHNLYTIIYKQKHEQLPALSEFRSDVPLQMQHAVDGLLRKDRDQRWPDAAQFLSALRPAAASHVMAPPAMTKRPRVGTPAASTELESSPTIMYRPQDEAHPANGGVSGTSPAPHEATPAVRFSFHEGDAAESEQPAAPRGRSRRLRLLIGSIVVLMVAGAMAPLISAGEDRGREVSGREQPDPPSATQAAAAENGTLGEPAELVAITADQTGYVGEPLPVPVGLVVKDANGRAVAGAVIDLEVLDGRGVVSPAEAVADSEGLAMSRWTLGETPGVNELQARVRGMPEIAVVVRATGVAGRVGRLVAVTGADQRAARGSTLADPVVVRVEDSHGNPVAGRRVEFDVRSGDGTVRPAFAVTDSAGVARTSWTMGTGQETNTLRATISESDLHVDFSARAHYRLTPRVQLVAGGTHTCALAPTGGVSCWGGNDNGQLGAGGTGRLSGARVAGGSIPFARLTAGVAHSCALDRAGAAYCWGVNDNGQLGTGDRNDRSEPGPVRTTESFVAITAGLTHTCALVDSGRAFCWGTGSGQPGDGGASERSSPAPVAGRQTFTTLSAGWRHTCGITSSNIAYCWGSNSNGQLGIGTSTNRTSPARVAGDIRFTGISTGAAHTCGVTATGEAYCWGQNGSGQLGSGSRTDSARPAPVQTDVPFFGMVAGAVHTCALTREGEAYCWGRNNLGQLGNGSTTDSPIPVAVAGGLRFTSLAAIGSHTCGRADRGEYYCWGYNVDGQLGDGTRTDRSRPVRVAAR